MGEDFEYISRAVELQRVLPELKANGVAVFGISYDAVEILARFSDTHGIAFPLLYQACRHDACLPPSALRFEFAGAGVALVDRELPARSATTEDGSRS